MSESVRIGSPKPDEYAINFIQPVSDDFSTEGYLDEFARIDHQHPLSQSLRDAIFNSTAYVKKSGDVMTGSLTTTGLTLTAPGTITFPNGMTITGNVGDVWMRASSNFYNAGAIIANDGYLSIGNSGNTDATWKSWLGNTRVLTLRVTGGQDGNGNIRFDAANPYISAGSYIIIPGGAYFNSAVTYFAAVANFRGNIQNDQGALSIFSQTFPGRVGHNAAAWNSMNCIIDSNTGNEVGMALWNEAGGLAPIIRTYQTFGERVDFLNSANSAYTTICAGAFTVISSMRVKQDIVPVGGNELLAAMSKVRTQRYLPRIRPQNIRPVERFKELNQRWQAHGRSPLRLEPKYTYIADHDCSIDNCPTICPIALNDHRRFGLIAEDLNEVLPEVVSYGEDGLPAGYDVEQIAALSFGGVGALARLIAQLHERLAYLEERAA